MATKEQALEAFRSRLDYVAETNCWRWIGPKVNDYGQFYDPIAKRQILAHRWAYQTFRDVLPMGARLWRSEKCQYKDCCNPWHWEPVFRGGGNAPSLDKLVGTSKAMAKQETGVELTREDRLALLDAVGARYAKPTLTDEQARENEKVRLYRLLEARSKPLLQQVLALESKGMELEDAIVEIGAGDIIYAPKP